MNKKIIGISLLYIFVFIAIIVIMFIEYNYLSKKLYIW